MTGLVFTIPRPIADNVAFFLPPPNVSCQLFDDQDCDVNGSTAQGVVTTSAKFAWACKADAAAAAAAAPAQTGNASDGDNGNNGNNNAGNANMGKNLRWPMVHAVVVVHSIALPPGCGL
ncbi:hypothetical protein AURDEDRAFT_156678 [Auricularia subglabra TFB-10046 SS5]|nr:hypothetical protein AURDEDRAFT_156678 [Auricularia subglabra TFB-10046 SS5]